MAYKCEICKKSIVHGHWVSHAKNRTSRLFYPNLRHATILIGNTVTKVKLCLKCLKRAKLDGRYPVKKTERKVEKKKDSSVSAAVTPKIETPKVEPVAPKKTKEKKEKKKMETKKVETKPQEVSIDAIVGRKK